MEDSSPVPTIEPTKSCILYWIRHAETVGNVERNYVNNETTLTDRGRAQAKLLGERLSHVPFTRVYSSHLSRAVETLDIIQHQSKQKQLSVTIDERIRKRGLNEFEGKSYASLHAIRGKGLYEGHPLFPYAHFYFEGTESIMDILARGESFFQDLMKEVSQSPVQETVLLLNHSYFTSLWIKHLSLPNSKHEFKDHCPELEMQLPNCGFHQFKLSWKMRGESDEPVLCWEALEIRQIGHLVDSGFLIPKD